MFPVIDTGRHERGVSPEFIPKGRRDENRLNAGKRRGVERERELARAKRIERVESNSRSSLPKLFREESPGEEDSPRLTRAGIQRHR